MDFDEFRQRAYHAAYYFVLGHRHALKESTWSIKEFATSFAESTIRNIQNDQYDELKPLSKFFDDWEVWHYERFSE